MQVLLPLGFINQKMVLGRLLESDLAASSNLYSFRC